jgi:hypothetical protein
MDDICQHCKEAKSVRNPTGTCDHLYWPDNLTDEARYANGYLPKAIVVWFQEDASADETVPF